MKISVGWLRDYVDFELSADALADVLAQRGMEIESLTAIGDDVCIDIEITPNRPDLLSHLGIAREVAAHVGSPLRIPEITLQESDQDVTDVVRVEVAAPELCPRYTARVLTDVEVGPAPDWMRRRLETIGLRPVSNIVDITNYVLMECGQPEHAFDFECLDGGVVVVRPAQLGEVLTLIDGSMVKLADEHLVIADKNYPVALAGIMGGLETEIGERTKTVLLESARFNPVSIRRSTRSTGQSSDSSYRFERGVDAPTVEWASRRAAALIQEHAGATLARGVVDANFTDEKPRVVRLRVTRIERVLGMAVSADDAATALGDIGFGVQPDGGDAFQVTVPSFRPDVSLEIDLIEEVARCRGYDAVPDEADMPIAAVTESKSRTVTRQAREVLIRLGCTEAMTSTFLTEGLAADVSPWSEAGPVTLSNPLRADEAALRTSLLPSLLGAKRTNQDRGIEEVRLFEVGRVYLARSGEKQPDEKNCLAIVSDESFRELKGAVETLLEELQLLSRVEVEPAEFPFLAVGGAARCRVEDRAVGFLGELSEEMAERLGLRNAPQVCELDLDLLVAKAALERRFEPLPRFPTVERDLAIVVDEHVTWQQILDAVWSVEPQYLESVAFGEIYRGQQIDAGEKSVMFSLVYRAPDRTLTGDEVQGAQERVVAALADALGAELRA